MPGLTFSFRRQTGRARPSQTHSPRPSDADPARHTPEPATSPPRSVEEVQRTTDPGPATVESHFWLTRRDQAVFAGLCLILLALLAISWLQLTNCVASRIEIERQPSQTNDFRFDVNQATWVEFRQLDGIGEALAHRIVEDRDRNGPFQSIDDLHRVRGIGPKTLARIRPWLTITRSGKKP